MPINTELSELEAASRTRTPRARPEGHAVNFAPSTAPSGQSWAELATRRLGVVARPDPRHEATLGRGLDEQPRESRHPVARRRAAAPRVAAAPPLPRVVARAASAFLDDEESLPVLSAAPVMGAPVMGALVMTPPVMEAVSVALAPAEREPAIAEAHHGAIRDGRAARAPLQSATFLRQMAALVAVDRPAPDMTAFAFPTAENLLVRESAEQGSPPVNDISSMPALEGDLDSAVAPQATRLSLRQRLLASAAMRRWFRSRPDNGSDNSLGTGQGAHEPPSARKPVRRSAKQALLRQAAKTLCLMVAAIAAGGAIMVGALLTMQSVMPARENASIAMLQVPDEFLTPPEAEGAPAPGGGVPGEAAPSILPVRPIHPEYLQALRPVRLQGIAGASLESAPTADPIPKLPALEAPPSPAADIVSPTAPETAPASPEATPAIVPPIAPPIVPLGTAPVASVVPDAQPGLGAAAAPMVLPPAPAPTASTTSAPCGMADAEPCQGASLMNFALPVSVPAQLPAAATAEAPAPETPSPVTATGGPAPLRTPPPGQTDGHPFRLLDLSVLSGVTSVAPAEPAPLCPAAPVAAAPDVSGAVSSFSTEMLARFAAEPAPAPIRVGRLRELTNLRDRPASNSTVIRQLTRGTQVAVLRVQGSWLHVALNDEPGTPIGFIQISMMPRP